MQSILDIIEPIKLLKGSHSDTAQTGRGCFMNVVAFLNGEAQITDQSPCVCAYIRPLAIWLNDYLRDDERAQLVPFVERAMGSATSDEKTMAARRALVVELANDMAAIAKWHAADAADAADDAADAAADAAAAYAYAAAADAADAAARAARAAATRAAYAESRKEIIRCVIGFLDAALSQAEQPSACALERAETLRNLAHV